ncbi:MAG: transglutaminase-like cysteine peptidase [Rhodospirillaceae bacterium]
MYAARFASRVLGSVKHSVALIVFLTCTGCAGTVPLTGTASLTGTLPPSTKMADGVVVPGGFPAGYLDFCRRHAAYCQSPQNSEAVPVVSVSGALAESLNEINRTTNQEIARTTDREAFGKDQYWEPARTKGDCKAIALRKMEKLLALGLPRSALRLAVARTEAGAGHAVLTIDTAEGTYVLDSRFAQMRDWASLPYTMWTREHLHAAGWDFPPLDASGKVHEITLASKL